MSKQPSELKAQLTAGPAALPERPHRVDRAGHVPLGLALLADGLHDQVVRVDEEEDDAHHGLERRRPGGPPDKADVVWEPGQRMVLALSGMLARRGSRASLGKEPRYRCSGRCPLWCQGGPASSPPVPAPVGTGRSPLVGADERLVLRAHADRAGVHNVRPEPPRSLLIPVRHGGRALPTYGEN